jgi:hypothetical protein
MLEQLRATKISRKLGGLQEPLLSGLCHAAQFCRDLQDLDRHGHGAAPPRTGCHEIVFGSQVIVRADRGGGTVPEPTVLIFDDRGECSMDPLARCWAGGLVDRRSYQRVSEPHLRCIEINEFRRDGGRQSINSDACGKQCFAGSHDFVEGRHVVFRGDMQQRPGDIGQIGQAAGKGAFKPRRQWKP